jgi:hypothetical protein
VRHRGAREEVERRIVLDPALLDHAAVTVARVLAEADIGHHEKIGDGLLHRAYGLLDDAVLGVGLAAARVLLRGQAEEQHRGDAHGCGVLALLEQLVDGQAKLSRHGRDGLAHAAAVDGEERVDEVVGPENGLADHPADKRRLAEPPGPVQWKRHILGLHPIRLRHPSLVADGRDA